MPGTGQRFGRYELIEPLGSGGMGIVHRARDTRLDREVALKVMDERRLASARSIERFEQEARLAGALNHPNVLVVFDAGEQRGVPFLVTELLEGQTLRQLLAAGPLPWREALALAVQVAEGLAAAHARGIVHRDLKPENLFLTREGRLKILDFGVAKLLEDPEAEEGATRPPPVRTITAESGAQNSGVGLGTPAYMSPEQVRGQPADARSDVFAFGCVLHELLSGRRPFAGKTPGEVGAAILTSEPQPLPAALPPALTRLVARCLQKKPALRHPDAASVLDALKAVTPLEGRAAEQSLRRPQLSLLFAGLAAGLALGTAGGWALLRRVPPAPAGPRDAPLPRVAPAPQGSSEPAALARAITLRSSEAASSEVRSVPAPPVASRGKTALPDQAPPGVQRIDRLLRSRRFKEAIDEARVQLAKKPPREVERQLRGRLAQASYDDGDDDGALRESVLYRALCPPAELPALDQRISRLRQELGLAPEPH